MQIKTISRSANKKVTKEKRDELIKEMRKDHEKLVKGKFEFDDAKGGWLEFAYRIFPDDLLVTYKLVHGEICEIPLAMAKHLNNTVHKIRTPGDQNGFLPTRGTPSTYQKISRVKFITMDVM